MSVNDITMARKKSKISDKEMSFEYDILNNTREFMVRLLKTKNSELEYCLKLIETNYSDELQERIEKVYEEIQNLNKKIQWEIKQCDAFDNKIKKFEQQRHLEFISLLSKKILNKDN